MKPILVLNSGSSSVKFQVVDVSTKRLVLSENIERVSDHGAAFESVIKLIKASGLEIEGIGHRVVHGGSRFSKPTIIDDDVVAAIEQLSTLAPLHNPGNLAGIRASRIAFPGVSQVAVFDTAFHQTMPESSYRYPIAIQDAGNLRSYGFHGTSYSYVTKKTADYLGVSLSEVKAVLLHLGNGASACAVRAGKSLHTSMGLTPLAGLVMGTRSGDIDPGLILHLLREGKMSVDEVDDLLNKRSGLVGLCGKSDMRDIEALAERGDEAAILALEIYTQRIKHYVGAYLAQLNGAEAIVFTAGIGENSPRIRELVTKDLSWLGIKLDDKANQAISKDIRDVSASDSKVRILVVPTNEELEIALQVSEVLH
jgi:acetate kinase